MTKINSEILKSKKIRVAIFIGFLILITILNIALVRFIGDFFNILPEKRKYIYNLTTLIYVILMGSVYMTWKYQKNKSDNLENLKSGLLPPLAWIIVSLALFIHFAVLVFGGSS